MQAAADHAAAAPIYYLEMPSHDSHQPQRCLHFVGFKDDRYWNAVKVYGRPDFIHRTWDQRARREIWEEGDTVVFAHPPNAPSARNGNDLDEWIIHPQARDDSQADIEARATKKARPG